MTKKIRHKDNQEVSHAWAYAGAGEGGTNSKGSFWYCGGELYSYSTIIFKRLENGLGLENKGNYSNTTSNHQRLARMAFNGTVLVGAWEDAPRGDRVFSKENIINSYTWKLEQEIANLAGAKRESTRTRYKEQIDYINLELSRLIEHKILLKKDLPVALKALLGNDLQRLLKSAHRFAESEAKLAIKRAKEREKEIKEEIVEFRAGKRDSLNFTVRDLIGHDLIRLEKLPSKKSLVIRTSQGVVVALALALGLYLAAKEIVSGKAKEKKIESIGKYPVNSIDKDGNCKVGCHYFTFKEIERCYKEEYLKTL